MKEHKVEDFDLKRFCDTLDRVGTRYRVIRDGIHLVNLVYVEEPPKAKVGETDADAPRHKGVPIPFIPRLSEP